MIKQKVKFKTSPSVIYDILMDSKKHSEATQAKAKIDNKVGGKFSVWDGYATGENLELIKGKKIVQSWRASDWPENSVSKLTITLKPSKDGTVLEFTHENVPKDFEKDIEDGWNEYYWEPLTEYLENL